MAEWALFTTVAGVLTVLLLVLARQSQQLLDSQSTTAESGTLTERDQTTQTVDPVGEQFDDGPPESAFGEQAAGVESDSSQRPDEESMYGDGTQGSKIELTSTALFANVAATQGLVIAVLVAAAWYFEIPASGFGVTGDPASTGLQALLFGAVFGTVLWVGNELSTTVADAVGASYDEALRETMAPESTGGWFVLFGLVLPIIAIAEELLFRGALIGVPAAGFDLSPWLLAVAASLAFALGHGAQGRVGIVVTGVLGFVLAAGYIVSGSLLVVIVAHYLINGLEFFVHEYLGVELFSTIHVHR
ncbi:MAG: type II CAAX endopeptidase family protein [Halovenus sp.]